MLVSSMRGMVNEWGQVRSRIVGFGAIWVTCERHGDWTRVGSCVVWESVDGCNWVQVGRGMRVDERHGGCTWVGAWLDRGVLTSSFRLTGCRMVVRRKEEMQCGIRCGCQLGSVDAWCIQGGMRGMVCGRDIVAYGGVVWDTVRMCGTRVVRVRVP